jgi:uncharacterized SAM-binding protein YcdF (DUF218 family)
MNEGLRHALETVANPVALALLLGLSALVFWLRHRRRMAATLGVCGLILGYLSGLDPVGAALLRPLEARDDRVAAPAAQVRYIAVLGSSYTPRKEVSSVAALDREGLVRVVEGVRLWREHPAMRLIVSGGGSPGVQPAAWGSARLARDLGVDSAALIILDRARDTADEAQAIVSIVGSEPFLLVTSAWHMPRALRLVQRAGGRAIPVPTGQESDLPCHWLAGCVLPGARGLTMTELATHEYLGLAALDLHLE